MHIWPAIDLRGGNCVRLQQGDYQRETVFGTDPGAMARQWVDQGAQRLHVVDLDGARDGQLLNLAAVRAIVDQSGVPCQLGGGVRDEATIEQLLEAGLERLVVGTQAIKEPDWFRAMCQKFPGHLVLGIDARDGQVATDGWLETSSVDAVEMAQSFANEPLAAIVYTDIAKDGMLAGPNVSAVQRMVTEVDLPVVASGGVSVVDDVAQLATTGASGCIIGRALYEDRFSIEAAQEAVTRA